MSLLPYPTLAKIELTREKTGRGELMKRREFITRTAALGAAAALPSLSGAKLLARLGDEDSATYVQNALTPPKSARIPVAFVISDGAVMIDFAGPWEVFQDVYIPTHDQQSPFRLYTVAESTRPV